MKYQKNMDAVILDMDSDHYSNATRQLYQQTVCTIDGIDTNFKNGIIAVYGLMNVIVNNLTIDNWNDQFSIDESPDEKINMIIGVGDFIVIAADNGISVPNNINTEDISFDFHSFTNPKVYLSVSNLASMDKVFLFSDNTDIRYSTDGIDWHNSNFNPSEFGYAYAGICNYNDYVIAIPGDNKSPFLVSNVFTPEAWSSTNITTDIILDKVLQLPNSDVCIGIDKTNNKVYGFDFAKLF